MRLRIQWLALAGLLIAASEANLLNGIAGTTNTTSQLGPSPAASARQRELLDDWVTRATIENDAEYTRMFTELGMKPEDRERFKSQLTQLYRKAIAAGEPMRELVEARVSYDEDVHAVLGDENYQRYRSYEESKPARREYELLREFASKSNNLTMDPVWSEKIVELIKNSKATTTESWVGPYAPLPHPEVGLVMVAASLSRKAAEYTQASSNLVQVLPKTDLPGEYQRVVKEYCSHKIAEMDRDIARFSVPKEEFLRRMNEEAQKEHDELMLKKRMNSPNQLF